MPPPMHGSMKGASVRPLSGSVVLKPVVQVLEELLKLNQRANIDSNTISAAS